MSRVELSLNDVYVVKCGLYTAISFASVLSRNQGRRVGTSVRATVSLLAGVKQEQTSLFY